MERLRQNCPQDPTLSPGSCSSIQKTQQDSGMSPACFYFADGLRNIRTDCIYFPLTPEMVSKVENDGWLEYDHHTFTVDEDEHLREVNMKFSLSETSSELVKSGLYLDGVVIRPVTLIPGSENDGLFGTSREVHMDEDAYSVEEVDVEEIELSPDSDTEGEAMDVTEVDWEKFLPNSQRCKICGICVSIRSLLVGVER
ncbi:hypothetical protein Mapa_014572 [Marchantia paleacea]|nr:hypothetical protein Mapa_014572 [Marchantia paleacea]